MSTPFKTDYDPPIPVLTVSLARPDEPPRVGPLNAVMDTGADGTLIPSHFLDALSPSAGYETRLRPTFGPAWRVTVYLIDMVVNGQRLPAVNVVGWTEGNDIILGRNVLNRLALLLDGPRGLTDLLAQRPRLVKEEAAYA